MPRRRPDRDRRPAAATASAVTVLPAGPEQAAAIAALSADALAPAWSGRSVADYLAAPGSFALLAWPGPPAASPAPAGFLLARVGADSCDVAAMAVAPAARGRGLGAALLEKALDRAAAMGAREMFLEVAAGNRAARALYRSRGFRVVGRRAGYYRGAAPADALVMRREIGPPKRPPKKSPPRP